MADARAIPPVTRNARATPAMVGLRKVSPAIGLKPWIEVLSGEVSVALQRSIDRSSLRCVANQSKVCRMNALIWPDSGLRNRTIGCRRNQFDGAAATMPTSTTSAGLSAIAMRSLW